MIAIAKSSAPPASLVRAAPAARQALEQAYDADPAGCQQPGTAALKPQRGIYAARDVKQQLRADQHQNLAGFRECRQAVGADDQRAPFAPQAQIMQNFVFCASVHG